MDGIYWTLVITKSDMLTLSTIGYLFLSSVLFFMHSKMKFLQQFIDSKFIEDTFLDETLLNRHTIIFVIV